MGRPLVLAYYFPDWHQDPLNDKWFGRGWTEWELVRDARPRFPGHHQPRVPLLGHRDESDPDEAARDIAMASSHGVDGFLVDYYWYEDGPYLSSALDDGLLNASNIDEVKFALMWANHDLVNIFPSQGPGAAHQTLRSGAISRTSFERFAHVALEKYFSHDSYLTIDGAPWLSIYQVGSLLEGLGGVAETADALAWFRDLAREHGFPDLHLDAVVWGFGVLPGAIALERPGRLLEKLGFSSATSYVWIHHDDLGAHPFPAGDIERLRERAFQEYDDYAATLPVPFYPNVTVGWDSSPRTRQEGVYEHADYPWYPVFDASPTEFREGLLAAQSFLNEHRPPNPVVTINAWNEWTEGSSLLPDSRHGYGYLEAVRKVFGRA
ncbi:glycosyltransferase WbsX family protein [Microbacterium dauci]|uniref:Glycoside hydrolase family 99-like domain-containing protein n=1 Tax=Microbacterium dauci TaxID=3048008 RepID=A0ABT6ZGN2_9MICO|nr:glycoside hydrolase family 99-like domain-containing protein [Microbacterium sp. LX3-4]MDJ1115093.1 glycoside hydrolase family 99-like domain-containing protein [Microbacterium sp. LX3-4]